MNRKITDKQIRRFFWEAEELQDTNKASFVLGDLSVYGVSRCKKTGPRWNTVLYEFDVYRTGTSYVALIIELTTDFTLKEIERNVITLWSEGGMTASDDADTLRYWVNEILPVCPCEHARYSAMRFLEALRRELLWRKSKPKKR